MRRTLIYLLYRLAQAAALPFIVAYLIARGLREPRFFRTIPERLGWLPHSFHGTAHGSVWLHAVSVGEVLSSVRLLERLREEYPSRRLLVSTTTLSGRALADVKLRDLVDGVFYAPLDYCFAVRRVLRELRPSVVIVLETEIWPNLFRESKRSGAGLVILNGRISDRAMPRYRQWTWFFREVLMLPDILLAQSEIAVERFRELGAAPDTVRMGGNLKYDFDPAKIAAPAPVRRVIEASAPGHVWIAASTMPPGASGAVDEDDAVIAAFRQLSASRRDLLLVVAPRHPVRFDEVEAKLDAAGAAYLRRSRLTGEESIPLPGVLLLDSIGELNGLFAMADAVFMGGTLARRGGHNILEPAFSAKPIIIGPHMENFPDIAGAFRAAGALAEIPDAAGLAGAVEALLADPDRCLALGQRALRLAEARRGATERGIREISRLSDWALSRPIRPALASALLWPLSKVWEAGWRWKRGRAVARRRSLPVPVVSIGGISMGGSGKTPCVLHIAEKLREAGAAPAILTRGYRRISPEKSTLLGPGASASTTLTGDEAQLFLRSGIAPVGIGKDRFETGTELLRRFPCDVVLLDDGYQHWRLRREIDVVLIDALDPFPGEAVFPLGYLREPLQALARADVFLITRAERGRPVPAIEARLRQYNRRAPVFRSRVTPLEWIDLETAASEPPAAPAGLRAAAFCGLANPASFWQTLAGLGIHTLARWEFADHHHYGPRELRKIAVEARGLGAGCLLTTEKDIMNLPPEAAGVIKPLGVKWLRIGMEVDREPELLDILEHRLRAPARARA